MEKEGIGMRPRTVLEQAPESDSVRCVLAQLYTEHRTWEAVATFIGEGSAPYWRYVALGKRKLSRKAHRALNARVGRIVLGEL